MARTEQNRAWNGGRKASFVVRFRHGRDYPLLMDSTRENYDPSAAKARNYDQDTGVMWGRFVTGQDEEGWESSYFSKRNDAISFAKDLEHEYLNSAPLNEEQRKLELKIYGGFLNYLELYIEDKYGNVFWDYPKTLPRPLNSFLISRLRWHYLLLPGSGYI